MIGVHDSLLRRAELLPPVLAGWLESCDRPMAATAALVVAAVSYSPEHDCFWICIPLACSPNLKVLCHSTSLYPCVC